MKERYQNLPIYVETKEERNERWLENIFFWVKLLGSLISLFDLMVKIFYYSRSRFSSKMLKQIYSAVFYFRPILISIVLLYNLLINIKRICKNRYSKNKKYKDDVAYQREMVKLEKKKKDGVASRTPTFQLELMAKTLAGQMVILLLKHCGMVCLCYSGFVRFLSSDEVARMPIVFGHAFEILAQNIPLMII